MIDSSSSPVQYPTVAQLLVMSDTLHLMDLESLIDMKDDMVSTLTPQLLSQYGVTWRDVCKIMCVIESYHQQQAAQEWKTHAQETMTSQQLTSQAPVSRESIQDLIPILQQTQSRCKWHATWGKMICREMT